MSKGALTLTWDNSSSLMTSKKIEVSLAITKPAAKKPKAKAKPKKVVQDEEWC